MEFMKQELAVLWVAQSSEDPDIRARRRKEFGYGPLYVSDEEEIKCIFEHRQYYHGLLEELRMLRSSLHQSTDLAERAKKEKRINELELDLLVRRAAANAEQLRSYVPLKFYALFTFANFLIEPGGDCIRAWPVWLMSRETGDGSLEKFNVEIVTIKELAATF
jgi:hypothetical protein